LASYDEKSRLVVWTRSGGRCSFPGCSVALLLDTAEGDASLVGQMAHIVAKSRQGPRGRDPLDDVGRRDAANFILLCPEHHKLVDDHPRHFPVPVLRRMKHEHESRFAPTNPKSEVAAPLVDETLASSMLWVGALPARMYSARTTESAPGSIARAVTGSDLVPFWLRDGVLHSFHDLSDPGGPLARVVTPGTTHAVDAESAWGDPDLFRRYVTLLNKSMSLHLARKGLAFDSKHHRHHFLSTDGRERNITYETRSGSPQRLAVVHRERKRSGAERMSGGIRPYVFVSSA
jgi:hypothetical protein